MGISIEAWRCSIGAFVGGLGSSKMRRMRKEFWWNGFLSRIAVDKLRLEAVQVCTIPILVTDG